jgi:O-antigen/teichoic acid export membrane protein
MRQTLKRLAKMTVGYGAVQWAGPAISLIFTPILTRILTPSDYGITEYVLTVGSFIGAVALFALPQALATHFNDRPEDEGWQRCVTGSALSLALLIGAPVGVTLVAFAPQISQLSLQDQRFTIFFQLMGATLVIAFSSLILTAAAQAALRVRWGMMFSLTTMLVTVLGNIVFIIVLRLGALGMYLVQMATGIALCMVAGFLTRRMIGKPSPAVMYILLRSGIVLVPTVLAGLTLQVVDRLFLIHYVSTTSLGHYAIANRIAGLLYVVMGPVYTAWVPLALATQYDPDAKQRYVNMARYLIAAALLAALGLGLFSTEILIVMTRPAYLPAAPYVGFLTYVQVFSAIGTVLSTGALVGKRLKEYSLAVVVGAVVNIILNVALIPPYGVWGATIATVVGYAVPQVILYVVLQKTFPIPYPTAKLLGALAIQVGLLLVGTGLPPLFFPVRLSLKLLIFSVLPLSFLRLGVITPFEIRQARLFTVNQLRRVLIQAA